MMEQAKQARTSAKMQFTRAEKSLLDALNVPEIPISTLQRRFTELKKKWDTVQDSHDAYSAFSGEMEDEQVSQLDTWIQDLSQRFDEVEIKADQKIEKLTPKGNKQVGGHDNVSSVGQSAVKFDKRKFPEFDGNIRKYPQFREEFNKHIVPYCQENQRAFMLKGYLCPSVRDEVENCGEDFEAILDRLDSKYGNVERIISKILTEVESLPFGSSKQNSENILSMINIVEKAHRDLKRLGAEGEMCNATMLTSIERRMPSVMIQEWAKDVANKPMSSAGKFQFLLQFLEGWRNRLEYLSDGNRMAPEARGKVFHSQTPEPSPVSPKPSVVHSPKPSSVPSPKRDKCWIHQIEAGPGDHPIWRCREFLSLSVVERKKLVKENLACQICLRTHCPGSKSPQECSAKSFRCRVGDCKEPHSYLLHERVGSMTGSTAHTESEAGGHGDTILQTQNL